MREKSETNDCVFDTVGGQPVAPAKFRNGELAHGGRSYLRTNHSRDQRPAFICNKSKLNTKSPLPRAWGRFNLYEVEGHGTAVPSRRDFFLAAENFGTPSGPRQAVPTMPNRKSRVISMAASGKRESRCANGANISRFIFIRPGGGRKSGRFRSDTGGLASKTFA